MQHASIQIQQETEAIVVLCNAPDPAAARKIAEKLVGEQLAACVNILASCESVYRWEGKIERETEVPLLVKTVRANLSAVVAAIRATHPFETPEIVALPIIGGLPEYLEWVRNETKQL